MTTPPVSNLRQRLARADKNLTVPAAVSLAELPPGVKVSHVAPGSLAERGGIVAGEKITAINGSPVRDTVDFYFYGSEEVLALLTEDAAGNPRTVKLRKATPEETLGIEVEQFITQNCGCNCVFCFVHQLPDSMRKSLYVQDEDYRLSFMGGSYITGMNLKDADLDRIATQRLTPLYMSVHSVDEELRRWLLGLKKARPIVDILEFFKKHRLQLHTQIVLCPKYNDGAQLDATLALLESYHPSVQSIAIVPVGLTKWREGLPELFPVTPDYARAFLKMMRPRLEKMAEKYGRPLALLADEWYLIAGQKPPVYTRYGDMPQLENGVGMVYHFYKDYPDAKKAMPKSLGRPWRVAALTSTLSPPVLKKIVDLCQSCEGLTIDVIPVENTVFGTTIHVTGLLTGQDLGKAIKHNPFYDQYLLPGSCIRKWDQRFLDDITLDQMREQTGKLITPVLGGSLDFVETILEHAVGATHSPVTQHAFLAKHWANS